MKFSLYTLSLLVLSTLVACDRGQSDGPPTINLGRDECAECGMSIHEERSASALIVDVEGRRESRLFDDIGCMLDAQRAHANDLRVLKTFVHDHATNAWISSDSATFLATDGAKLRTPMASGIAAFGDRASAEAGRTQYGGELLDYSALATWRSELMKARYEGSDR